MTPMFKRIRQLKMDLGLTWEQLAAQAEINMASWMTGLPTSNPSDKELRKLAPVLGVTYEYLKYGKK